MERQPLKIVYYPHPTLRHESRPIKRVDADLVAVVREMFDLMYAAKGIGLAANQVDLPLRLFIVNLAGDPDEGEELVFINPVVSKPKGNDEAEEGCLSLPEVYGPVVRPKQVVVNAYNLRGEEIQGQLDGMLARVVQHELDHLNGVLFFDRMSPMARADVNDVLHEFELTFQSQQEIGAIPDKHAIAARLVEWESKYC